MTLVALHLLSNNGQVVSPFATMQRPEKMLKMK
jgi:hypothetical protein